MDAGSQQPERARDQGAAGTASAEAAGVLASAAADACALTGVALCAISLLDGDDALIVALAGARSDATPGPGARWNVADVPPARQAVVTERPVVLAGRDDPRLTGSQRRALIGRDDLPGIALLPLEGPRSSTRGAVRPSGLLVIADTQGAGLDDKVAALAPLTRLLGGMLSQVKRLEDLERSADALSLVLDADLEAQRHSSGPEQVLRVITRRLAALCRVSVVDIRAIEGERLRTVVSWRGDAFDVDQEGVVERLGDSPAAGVAALTGRPEVVCDLHDPRLTTAAVERLQARGMASFVTIPLGGKSEVIGVAEAYDTAPRDYTEVLGPAGALGEIAAHILGRALLLQTVEQRNRSLREIVALSAIISQTASPADLARFVADRIIEVLGTTCCEVYKIEEGEMRCLASIDVRPGFSDPDAVKPVDLELFPSLKRAIADHELLVFTHIGDPRLTERERSIFRRWEFTSELSIPLLVGDRLVGLIDVFDQHPRDFAEHLDFARGVGQLVAGAFDNLLLVERLAESNQELRLLAESSLEFGASLDLQQVLHSVASRMCLAADAACCDIYAVEGEVFRGLVSVDRSEMDEAFPGTTYELADFAVAVRAVETMKPVAVTDLATDALPTEFERAEDMRFGFRALLELPLLHRGEVVGIASIFDTEPRAFEHLDLLRGLGQIAAQAVENARVHRALDAGAERLALVNAASLELTSSLDLPSVLAAAARRLCAACAASNCDVYLVHGSDVRCEASIARGRTDRAWLGRTHALEDWAPARLAIESRSVVSIESLADPNLSEDDRRFMTAHGQRSSLVVPLAVEDRVLGVAELFEAADERRFDAADISIAEAICRVAAIAVANAGLYGDLELRSRESDLLNRIAAKVGASLDTEAIASATFEELADVVPFTEACLVLDDREESRRVVHATHRRLQALPRAVDAAVGRLFDDLRTSGRIAAVLAERLETARRGAAPAADVVSLLVVGIAIDDDALGALVMVSTEAEAFAAVDRGVLARVGTQLALSFRNARLHGAIKSMHASNLKALIAALNTRDEYAVGHAARVAAYMRLLGRELGWDDDRLRQVTEASLLHDVGRIGVADDVLFKPGRLTQAEMAELRDHPAAGAEMIRPLVPEDYVLAVRHHHERWDGQGYPDGLAGDQIPELARALCIVDSYDAMSYQRAHHATMSYAECLAELSRCRSVQFDPTLVGAFMRVLDRLDERRLVVRATAETAAARIDGAELAALAALGDRQDPAYVSVADRLREVRDAASSVRFLAAMVADDAGWTVVCDPDDDSTPHPQPGDVIDRALVGDDASAERTDRNVLLVDEYGVWVSGEAPVADDEAAPAGLVRAVARPDDDWPAAAGHDAVTRAGAFAAAVGSATARLGKARVDAVTDGLTGLYNQRYFKQRLAEEVVRAADLGSPLSLLFCDLDDFKGFNDRHGHAAGDRALRAVAATLVRSLRQVDIAARYGGEEFTVILLDTEAAGALDVAERIRNGVGDLAPEHGVAAALSVSIGMASFPAHATVVDELLDKADWAMYLAKRQGRDRVVPFSAASAGPGVTATE